MEKTLFVEMLEKYQDKFASRELVLQLCSEGASDYDRGRIQGQIEMLTKLMMELSGEASTVQE